MPKEKKQARGLFDPPEEEQRPETTTETKPTSIINPCPRCGGKSARSARPEQHDGLTHYCLAGCMSEDRYDAFYFMPEVPF